MERIQAAIAKARAAREAAPGDRAPRQAQRSPIGALPDPAAAWSALEEVQLDPVRMEANRICDSGQGPEGAAFDVLRTRALKLMKANGWKRMAITSPTAACGKSTVALNLGLSVSRPSDASAILVEIDMRRPSLAQKMGLRNKHSVAHVLSGQGAFADNAVRIGAQRFVLASNHAQVANPSDLLQRPEIGDVLTVIEMEYAPTIMLFDMPPLMFNDDTIAFLQHVDCALLVAAAEQSTIDELDSCERELAEHTNVLGITLNKCQFAGPKFAYGYQYT